MNFVPVDVIAEAHTDSVTLQNSAGVIALSPPVELIEQASEAVPFASEIPKRSIRTSLAASTWDGVFATIFNNVTGGALLINFLIELGATPTEIGIISSIPMLANLVQPIGAYISEKMTSRHIYCLWIYGVARSLWIFLAVGIFLVSFGHFSASILIALTIGVAVLSYFLGALGSAAWFSWMAALVPRQLRGRYFSFRNSAANLTNLISVPLMGLLVSRWAGGSLQGYGMILAIAIAFGFISLSCQNFMRDVNPQEQALLHAPTEVAEEPAEQHLFTRIPVLNMLRDRAFVKFLLYFNLWMFAVNLSAPFFNLFMLDVLKLDISQVTLYNSLAAGANLLMLMLWGKLADRVGNRMILLCVGAFFALTPLLWLVTGNNAMSIWLWIPLLHLLIGGSAAAIDLCNGNIQIEVAPLHQQSTYFGVAAALAGLSGAAGTMAGSVLAQFGSYGGVFGLFAISALLRLGALLPLVFMRDRTPELTVQSVEA